MSKIEQTLAARLHELRCPVHGKHPSVIVKNGGSQFEVQDACCDKLIEKVQDNMPRIMSEIIQEHISKSLKF